MVTPLLVAILPIGQKPRQPKKNEFEPSDVKENQSEVSNKNKTE